MKVKQKRKIAVLVGQLTHLGGVGIAAVNEVRELRKMGYEAELVVLFRKKEFDSQKIFKAEDISLIFLSDELPWFLRINFKFPFFAFFSFFHLSAIFYAPYLIKKKQYQLIVCHETYNCLAAIAAAKFNKIKLISFIWDPVSYIVPRVYGQGKLKFFMPVLKFLSISLDKLILKNSQVVLICSHLHEKVLRSLHQKTKLVKVYPGAEILTKLPLKRKKIIIALTKWDQGKNPEFLLKMAQRLKGDFQLHLGGNWADEEQRKAFLAKIKKAGLTKKIILRGRIFGREKTQFFAQARVLVHPIIEAFGMFGLEAAACGCPIILPKNSGVSELFLDGQHGFFPPENDLPTFVEKTQLLLDQEKKASQMGQKAWQVAKKYSWQYHTQVIVKEINQLVSQENPSL